MLKSEGKKKISLKPSWCFTARRVDEIQISADYLTCQAAGQEKEKLVALVGRFL